MLTAGHQADLGDKLEWAQLADAGAPRATALAALDGHEASVYLGLRSACSATVTGRRTWDQDDWAAEHGPAWSTGWAPLVADGTAP